MRKWFYPIDFWHWPLSFVVMGMAIVTALALEVWLLPSSASVLIMLLAIVPISLVFGFKAALANTLLGIVCYNLLFTEPRFSLHMSDYDEFLTMIVFGIVAIVISHLASLLRVRQRALEVAELRSRMLLSVSHDLRTPLASVIGTLSTLQHYQKKLAAAEQDELLTGALNEANRLHRYIENLLQATRIQHGAMQLKSQEFELEASIFRVKQRFAQPITLRVNDDQNTLIWGQRALFEQALYNIIENALEFSSNQTIQPRVLITRSINEKTVSLKIIDNGLGIDSKDQQHAFEAFYSSRKGDAGQGGSGLGLAVAEGIITSHGGTLAIENRSDGHRGCVVTMTLPRLETQEHTL